MNEGREIRVRFAPSPTGYLHVGGARTALFNYLFARNNNGRFILRIEDTDRERSDIELVRAILDGLSWLGLTYDEGPEVGGSYGPYFQSERKEIYRKHIEILRRKGHLYPCFCAPNELEERRSIAQKERRAYKYERTCINFTKEEISGRILEGKPYALRLLTSDEGETKFNDLIRGYVSFKNTEIEDFVVVRSDGSPTYNFSVVVDDHLMEITHVIRGEDHISNTPKQLLLYRAFGWEPPLFAHVPLIHGTDRKRLSKRHGAVSISAYKEDGILPEAMFNFLSLLGWSSGNDKEIMSENEIIKRFTIEAVSKSPAIFDTEKLLWMNGHYIRSIDQGRFISLAEVELAKAAVDLDYWQKREGNDWVRSVILIEREKMKKITDVVYLTEFFFTDDIKYDESAVTKYLLNKEVGEILSKVLSVIKGLNDSAFYPSDTNTALVLIESAIRTVSEEIGVSSSKVIHPTRFAISGRTTGPGLFEMIWLLGKKRCLERIKMTMGKFY
ncbi:MAG: glutamate--tRNA ligase [bacterium]